ncbi:hypothetical protein AALP_AA1G346500, partial [Arabis alpina]
HPLLSSLSHASITMAAPADTVDTTQALLNINMSNITKLTSTNYMTWSIQIHALLDGYALAGHLDGSTPPPPATITTDNVVAVNPAHTKWTRQDKLIFSGLLGTLTPSIQTTVTKAKTASAMWSLIVSIYANPSRGHVMQLKNQLLQCTKGDQTIDEYLQSLTIRFDQLALLGRPIEHEDQIQKILGGLPEDYKSLVEQIEGRENSPSIPELHEKLLTREVKLLSLIPTSSNVVPMSANMATSRHRPYQGKPNHRSPSTWNTNTNNNHQQPSHPRPDKQSKGYQGKCQICGVFGHSAKRCTQLQQFSASQNSLLPTPFRPWQPRANMALTSPNPTNAWLMDSGATHHMTSDLHTLHSSQPYNGQDAVLIGDGSGLSITHTGSLSLPSSSRNLALNSVLCVPNIQKNLVSVYRLCNQNNVSVEFFPAHFQVKDLSSGVPFIQGKTKDELYEWPASPSTLTSFFASTTPKLSTTDWHHRLGHPSTTILHNIVSKFSLPCSRSVNNVCSDCAINKTHKLPFSQTSIVSTYPLEYVFTDLWSSPVLSIDNYKYYLVLVDHYSRYTWMYPLKLKSQVKETFIAFKALVENRFNTKIKTLYSDNGGEFMALKAFLSSSGISHLTSPPHTPEHNGISERKHRHIVETGLTLLTHAKMPKTYWSYAFTTATYLINRMPTPVLDMESPVQKLFGSQPNYSKLRVFGCLCFPWLRPYNTNKLQDRSTPCIFIGYSQTQSAYLCLQPSSGRVYITRHVKFDESSFPFNKLITPKTIPAQTNATTQPLQPIITTIPLTPPRHLTQPPLVRTTQLVPTSSDLHQPASPPSTTSPVLPSSPAPPSPAIPPSQTTSPQVLLSPSISRSPSSDKSEPTAQIIHGPEPVAQQPILNTTSTPISTDQAHQKGPLPHNTRIQRILHLLADRFSVKDPEDLHYFLGIEAHRTATGLHLSQRKYILDLLHKYTMTNAKPVTTPMATSPKLTLNAGTNLSDPSAYRKLVGSLQYLAFTRLDIAYAVNRLSQFMHKPTEDHWQAAKRILRYLAGTPTHGLFYAAKSSLNLHAFSDADWAGDSDDYVSTNAYIIYLGKQPISWTAKKQKGVARSSTEAEYRAVANTVSELCWICNLLTELGLSLPTSPLVYCDNVGATFLCANPVFHSRMKHIALDYHFVRGHIQKGALRVAHVNTKDQLADALTKPLSRARFLDLRNKIGVTSAPPS